MRVAEKAQCDWCHRIHKQIWLLLKATLWLFWDVWLIVIIFVLLSSWLNVIPFQMCEDHFPYYSMSKTSPLATHLSSVLCSFQMRCMWAKRVWSRDGERWRKMASRRAFCRRLRFPLCPTMTALPRQTTRRRWSPTTCFALAIQELDFATVVKEIRVRQIRRTGHKNC